MPHVYERAGVGKRGREVKVEREREKNTQR
jgi:hypothetical protein